MYRKTRTPAISTPRGEMTCVGLIGGCSMPSACRPGRPCWLCSEDSPNCPSVNYRPYLGVQNVQDRARHRIAHAIEPQKPSLDGFGADGAAGGLTPVSPERI